MKRPGLTLISRLMVVDEFELVVSHYCQPKKIILFAVPVMKVKCILRSKVLLLLLVLLVKARSGSK
jgi:hypothetical protein